MPKNLSLSIRDKDQPLWDFARRYADNNHTTLSGLATMALAGYLRDREPEAATDDITVTVQHDNETQAVSFTGRWLVHPDAGELERTTRHRVGIAITAKHRIAVYHQDIKPAGLSGPAVLHDYDDLEQARQAMARVVNQLTWDQAEKALRPAIKLDI